MLRLEWSRGTLLLRGGRPPPGATALFKYDGRIGAYRCLALYYRRVVEALHSSGLEFVDDVIHAPGCRLRVSQSLRLRDYQREALEKWLRDRWGVVVLPTGAGKTHVGLAAMAEIGRASLVVVPTLELMDQWASRIARFLGVEPGRFGGGKREVGCITVTTYDSAYLNVEILGDKFWLVVFDEVHHLPSQGYRQIAELMAAPWRLGLTATPEREDGLHVDLPYLVGPVVYRASPREFAGRWLADFDVKRVYVDMSEEEKGEYRALIGRYRRYLEQRGIRFRGPEGFERLIALSVRDPGAREALVAWHRARRIALHASTKLDVLKGILERHRGDKVIIFTEHSDVVRRISAGLLIPEITYRTTEEERRRVLEMFRRGEVRALVTSKVLEEGVDVPDANVAIILSGTGSRREFIQRLGRILRPKKGGRAVLYEVVTRGTSEIFAARRRRRGLD